MGLTIGVSSPTTVKFRGNGSYQRFDIIFMVLKHFVEFPKNVDTQVKWRIISMADDLGFASLTANAARMTCCCICDLIANSIPPQQKQTQKRVVLLLFTDNQGCVVFKSILMQEKARTDRR